MNRNRYPGAIEGLPRWKNKFLRWVLCLGMMGGMLGSAFGHVNDTSLLRIRIEATRILVEWNADLLSLHKVRPLRMAPGGVYTRQVWEQDARHLIDWVRSSLELQVGGGVPDLGAAKEAVWESDRMSVPEGDWQGTHVSFRFERERGVDRGGIQISAARLLDGLGPQHSLIAAFIEGEYSQQVVLNREFPSLEYEARKGGLAGVEGSLKTSWGGLFRLGLEHILSGYDHLLFLGTLLVAAHSLRTLLGIITAFTIAHGLTLALSAAEWIRLPSQWVECAIALSIVWVAVENLVVRRAAPRWVLTFGFGLLHGLGFAGALLELRLPKEGLIGSVLSFNLGVEAGQLSFLAALYPALWLARGATWEASFRKAINAVAAMIAGVWFVQRWIQP